MKILFNNRITGWIFGLIFVATWACSDMNELSDRFLNQGAVVYGAIVDSAATHTGNKKIEMEILVKTQRIDFVRVYWNDYADSSDIQVKNTPGVYSKIIDIPEPSIYLFSLVSFDSYGNKSLPYEVSGTVVGDEFINNLSTRRIVSAASDNLFGDGTLVVNFGDEPTYALYSELLYTDNEGHDVVLRIDDAAAHSISIPSFDKTGGLRCVTYFKADETAIDVFRKESTVPLMVPKLTRKITTGIGLAGFVTSSWLNCGFTDRGSYLELLATNADPYIRTASLPEDIRSLYRVFFNVRYQTDRTITNGEVLFFGNGIGFTPPICAYENTGLDATDDSKWKVFSLDLHDYINVNFGAAGHYFRFDFVNGSENIGTVFYVKEWWLDVWSLEIE